MYFSFFLCKLFFHPISSNLSIGISRTVDLDIGRLKKSGLSKRPVLAFSNMKLCDCMWVIIWCKAGKGRKRGPQLVRGSQGTNTPHSLRNPNSRNFDWMMRGGSSLGIVGEVWCAPAVAQPLLRSQPPLLAVVEPAAPPPPSARISLEEGVGQSARDVFSRGQTLLKWLKSPKRCFYKLSCYVIVL